MEDLGVLLRLRLESVQRMFYAIIKTTSPGLKSPYSAGFTEYSLLPDVERHYIIDNVGPSIHIVLRTTSRRRAEEGLRDT